MARTNSTVGCLALFRQSCDCLGWTTPRRSRGTGGSRLFTRNAAGTSGVLVHCTMLRLRESVVRCEAGPLSSPGRPPRVLRDRRSVAERARQRDWHRRAGTGGTGSARLRLRRRRRARRRRADSSCWRRVPARTSSSGSACSATRRSGSSRCARRKTEWEEVIDKMITRGRAGQRRQLRPDRGLPAAQLRQGERQQGASKTISC